MKSVEYRVCYRSICYIFQGWGVVSVNDRVWVRLLCMCLNIYSRGVGWRISFLLELLTFEPPGGLILAFGALVSVPFPSPVASVCRSKLPSVALPSVSAAAVWVSQVNCGLCWTQTHKFGHSKWYWQSGQGWLTQSSFVIARNLWNTPWGFVLELWSVIEVQLGFELDLKDHLRRYVLSELSGTPFDVQTSCIWVERSGDAEMSGVGAVPLRLARMMRQHNNNNKTQKTTTIFFYVSMYNMCVWCFSSKELSLKRTQNVQGGCFSESRDLPG